jgi:hypothetical protein
VAARRIAHYKIGGRILFSEADVDAYLASCRVGAVAPKFQARLRNITWRSGY